jgi:DNA-binding NarL/FixJ family response regulator
VVGAGIGPEDVVERVRASAPDVVLFDVADNGLGWIEELFDAAPGAKVIVFGFDETEADVLAYARAGVSGFMTRKSSLDELIACIRSVDHDEFVCSPQVAAILLEGAGSAASSNGSGSPSSTLTARQLEILQLVDSGLSNKEIAQRLCIELSTVKNHVHHILEKLEVRSRREAAAALRSRSSEI